MVFVELQFCIFHKYFPTRMFYERPTDYERFKIKVAGALARWQGVELLLQQFLVAAIASPDWRWSSAAYNAVITFRGRLDMIHEILQWRLPSEALFKEWKTLKQKLIDHSALRNKLVHWTFVGTFNEITSDPAVYVVRPFQDARKGQSGKRITETDLEQMEADFAILQGTLTEFQNRVRPQLALPGTPS